MRPLTTPLGTAQRVPGGAPRSVAETADASLASPAAPRTGLQALGSGPR